MLLNRKDILESIKYTLSKQYLEETAYWFWENEGRLDGEELVDLLLGKIKRKNYHWILAESSRDEDLIILQDLLLICDVGER